MDCAKGTKERYWALNGHTKISPDNLVSAFQTSPAIDGQQTVSAFGGGVSVP